MTSNVFRENDGMHFTNPSVGDVIPFTHPITGTEHKLTVQDFELQELSARGSRVDDVVQRKADERHRNLIINMIEYLSIKNTLRKVGKGRNIWQREEEKRRSNKLI